MANIVCGRASVILQILSAKPLMVVCAVKVLPVKIVIYPKLNIVYKKLRWRVCCIIKLFLQQALTLTFLLAGRAGLAWGLSLAILFVAVIIAVIFYYRRRVSNLKTEIAHVHYISDPTQGWPDRHNFDNPVYGMHSNNPETRLLNNLRPKMNNLDCAGTDMYADDSNASSRGEFLTFVCLVKNVE